MPPQNIGDCQFDEKGQAEKLCRFALAERPSGDGHRLLRTLPRMDSDFSTANERDALSGFLDQQRDALIRKVQGVSDADARRTPTASSLSLLGLLKHSALWERRWFQVIVAGRALPGEWPEVKPSGIDEDFLVGPDDTVKYWTAYYAEQVAISRQIAAGRRLDDACARQDLVDENLRWVLLHLIEETARHAGHADIIRETIDGSRGM